LGAGRDYAKRTKRKEKRARPPGAMPPPQPPAHGM